ncbi:MAG: DNA-3-methyladenine glycosylase 2 family protein [Acidobacteria bacterium]|nr:DNA-3-methyladenine glycosylase 2 family protein [Acidobacteriota bacterium]
MRRAVWHLKKADPILRGIIARVGPCRMQFGEPTFHSLAKAIVYQQLHGKAAETIFKRLTTMAGDPLKAEGILKLSAEQMRSPGLSKQKSSYLMDMAARVVRGELDFSGLAEMTDEEVITQLTQVKGVGVWTAHMFLMFTLQRPNILPTGDFGVRMAMYKHYLARPARPKSGIKGADKNTKIALPNPEQMQIIAKAWEPYRSVACWYLWRSLELKTAPR